MIRKARFRNFKSLRDVDVEFERFTVIVGPNASGKTSILQGLDYVSKRCRLKSAEELASSDQLIDLLSRGAEENEFDVEVTTDDVEALWELRVDKSAAKTSTWDTFVIRVLADEGETYLDVRDLPDHRRTLILALKDAALLRFELGGLSGPSYSAEIPPRIDPNGSGLSTALAYLALNRPDAFRELQNDLRSIIPAVERIRFDHVPLFISQDETIKIDHDELTRQVRKQYVGYSLIFDFHGSPGIPASGASEGTLFILGLLAVVKSPNRPRLVLLDDLEHGLHPTAQRELVKLIRKLLAQDPDLQIIATSHSPYLLDDLEPREVLLTWADENGITSCARIDEHPEFEKWKDEMSPGEFWSVMGEKWVKDADLQKVS